MAEANPGPSSANSQVNRHGTHDITANVDYINTSGGVLSIGQCSLKYKDEMADLLEQVCHEVSESLDGSNADISSRYARDGSYIKKLERVPIDMPMLLYLCHEMAKKGNGKFFSALAKLGFTGKVLEQHREHFEEFATTARQNGHSELAKAIETSRELPCDIVLKTLTFGKLLDSIRAENRSLANFAYGPFLDYFFNSWLPKHPEAQELVKLEGGSERLLHLENYVRIAEIYCDYKDKNKNEHDKKSDRDLKRMKDNLKNTMAQFEKRGFLEKVSSGTRLQKQFLVYKIKDDGLWSLLKQNYPSSEMVHDGTSSETSGIGVGQSDDSSQIEILSHRIEDMDVRLIEEYVFSPGDTSSGAVNQEVPFSCSPEFCSSKGGCTFTARADRNLARGDYIVEFEDYGRCKASGEGDKHLDGEDPIPKAKRSGTHIVTVKVLKSDGTNEMIIGDFLFRYEDTEAELYAKTVLKHPSSSEESDSPEHDVPSKKMKKCPIDMPMLMYLCDETAKTGDEDFYRALIKLGILADVLANPSEYFKSFAVTAREHGHSELAELIAMSSRELSGDCLMEKLTLGTLVDAVETERSLANLVYSSDDDSDSSVSGYNGDSDSEDVGSDDDDVRSCIILQGPKMNFTMAELDSPEFGKCYEVFELEKEVNFEILELEVEQVSSKITGSNSATNPWLERLRRILQNEQRIREFEQRRREIEWLHENEQWERENELLRFISGLKYEEKEAPKYFPSKWNTVEKEAERERLRLKLELLRRKIESQRQIERKRNERLRLEMFGSVNVLGQYKSRGGRWKVMLMSVGSGCGQSLWQEYLKSMGKANNNSLTHCIAGFLDPCLDTSIFSKKCISMVVKLIRVDRCNESRNSSQMNEQIEQFVDINRDPVDELQSIGAKDVESIAFVLVIIDDELVAIKKIRLQ